MQEKTVSDFVFSPFPVITTERLTLRQPSQDDAEPWYFLRSDPQVLQYINREPAKDVQEVRDLISRVCEGIEKGDSIAWTVTMRDKPDMIGSISFWRMQKEHYRAEIGYVLHPDLHGKGLMSEAAAAIVDYGFRVMKLHSIEAHINPANKASRYLLEKLGFVREAYFRENFFYNGDFLDSAVYSLINPVK